MEGSQRVPWHSPYTLQGNNPKWQQISRARPRPSGQTTQMGSRTDLGHKEEAPPTPILGQMERVLRGTQQLGTPDQHQHRPAHQRLLPNQTLGRLHHI
jgi:hypothetical protein